MRLLRAAAAVVAPLPRIWGRDPVRTLRISIMPECTARPPSSGVGVKKINVPPYSPPAKLKPAAATAPKAFLDTPDRADSKNALGGVAPAGTGYEQAVTSCTLVRARVPRGFRARGIFPKKSLS